MIARHLKGLLIMLLLFGSQLHAQNQAVSLRDALKRITKSFGTQFVYDRQLIEGKTTSYNLNDLTKKSAEEVLKGVLYPNNLVFLYLKPNYYTIVPKDRVGESGGGFSTVSVKQVLAANTNNSGTIKVTGLVTDS